MFKSQSSHAIWTWVLLYNIVYMYLKWPLSCLHEATQENVVTQTDYFTNAFYLKNTVPGNDVVKRLKKIRGGTNPV